MADDKKNPKKPKQPLSAQLAMVGGIALAVIGSMVIAPLLFPKTPGQGFNFAQVLCAGVLGGIGGVLGWAIGYLIAGPPKKD